MAVIGVDYDEMKPESYKGVILSIKGVKKEFNTGNFIKDWYDCNKFILNSDLCETEQFSNSSSLDHFIMDGAPFDSAYLHLIDNDIPILKYEYSHKDPGLEFFVKRGETPTWEELRKYCGDKKNQE